MQHNSKPPVNQIDNMKEYKTRIEEIKTLFKRYNEAKEDAYSIEYSIDVCEDVLALMNESKRCRKLATKKILKLAEELGFSLLKDVKNNDTDFMSALFSIEARINVAIAALYDFDTRFNTSISIA